MQTTVSDELYDDADRYILW